MIKTKARSEEGRNERSKDISYTGVGFGSRGMKQVRNLAQGYL